MASEYYTHTTFPATSSFGSSAQMRAELDLIDAGFAKLPTLSGNAGKFVLVNAGANAQTVASTLSESGSTVTASNNLSVGAALSVGGAATLSSTLAVAGVATLTANPVLSSGTVNGVVYLNAGKAATSGSALTFDGSNLATTGTFQLSANTTPSTASGNAIFYKSSAGAVASGYQVVIETGSAGSRTTAATFDNSGNLGIGTTPATQLHVNNASATTARISTTSVQLDLQSNEAGGYGLIRTTTNHFLAFGTNSTERMRLDVSGNLGIGTASPATKLHVYSPSARQITSGNASSTWTFGASGSSFAFKENSAGAEQLILDSSGNLGVTGTPLSGGSSARWITAGSDAASAYGGGFISAQNGTAKGYVYYDNTGSSNSFIVQGAAGVNIGFRANAAGSNQMVLDTSGNLGLGVTPSTWTAGKVLELGATGNALWGYSGNTILTQNTAGYSGSFNYATTAPASYYGQSAGQHRWFNAPSGTAGNPITFTQAMTLDASGNLTVNTGTLGYGTGSGGAVTQATSRTTGVTLNKSNGAITLVSAAGSASWQSFTVTNSTVAATDVVRVVQASGTDLYQIHVTAVAAGSFRITFATTGGTTTEQPVFNFAVIKAVTA